MHPIAQTVVTAAQQAETVAGLNTDSTDYKDRTTAVQLAQQIRQNTTPEQREALRTLLHLN